jgi:hypothetical protein
MERPKYLTTYSKDSFESPISSQSTIKIKNTLCKLFGHKWRYLDYSNHIQANGDSYLFKASRNCTRCDESQYLYEDWKTEKLHF